MSKREIKPQLRIDHEDKSYTEIYLLNPGEYFPKFGGSRHDLIVRKTASIVIRRQGPWGLTDTEYDIFNEGVWDWIGKWMKHGLKHQEDAPE